MEDDGERGSVRVGVGDFGGGDFGGVGSDGFVQRGGLGGGDHGGDGGAFVAAHRTYGIGEDLFAEAFESRRGDARGGAAVLVVRIADERVVGEVGVRTRVPGGVPGRGGGGTGGVWGIVRNVVDDLRADVWGWSSGKGGERGVPGSSRGGRNRRARWFSKNERRAWRRRVDAPESSYAMV